MSVFEISEGDLPIVRTRQALLILDLQNDLVSTGGILPVDKPADFMDKIVALVPQFRRAGNIIWVRTQFESHVPINDGGASGERVITDMELSSTSGKGGLARRPRPPSKDLLELYNKMLANSAKEDEEAGIKVDEDEPEEPYENETFLTLGLGERARCLLPLSLGSNFCSSAVQVVDMSKDVFFTKTHYSAFTGGTLLQRLRGLFVTELFICGALTNISVFATTMDAARFGYSITLVEDCLGYRSKERHDEAVRQMIEATGCDMMTCSELLESINAIESARARSSNSRKPHRGMHESRNRPQMVTDLRLKSNSSKAVAEDWARPSSKGKNSTDNSTRKEEGGSSHESLQSVPAASDDSPPEKSLVLPKKPDADLKKRVPNKIKTRRRKSGSNDSGVSSNLQKATNGETLDKSKSLVSPTQATLTSASEVLEKIATVPSSDQQVSTTVAMKEQPSTTATAVETESEANPEVVSKSSTSVLIDEQTAKPETTSCKPRTSSDTARASVSVTNDDLAVLDSQAEDEGEDYTICEGDTTIIHGLLPEAESETIFESVRDEVRWQRMSHQGGEVPRLVAVQGEIREDGSIPIYRHPADESPPLLPYTPTISRIRFQVEKKLGHKVNHCLIQFYRSGTDYISEHSDKTLDIVKNTFIANVSLGAMRVMTFRTKKPSKFEHAYKDTENCPRLSCKAPLPHNSLCRMGLKTNMKWLHSIRQDKRRAEEKAAAELAYDVGRISLTFRLIGTFLDRDQIKIWGQGAVAKDKKDAQSVINGETSEAEKMLMAFGKENHSSAFDWEETYGAGFDVLHISNTRKLFLSGDNVANMRVKLMLTECGLSWVEGELSPLFNWKGGNPDMDIPAVPEKFPVRIVDDDLAHATVQGDIAILLYLDASYVPNNGDKSQVQKARQYTRLMETDILLQKWRADPFSVKPFRRLLALWDIFAFEDVYIAGPKASVADFAFWPVLHVIVEEWGEGIESPHLQAYYDRMKQRASLQELLGLSGKEKEKCILGNEDS